MEVWMCLSSARSSRYLLESLFVLGHIAGLVVVEVAEHVAALPAPRGDCPGPAGECGGVVRTPIGLVERAMEADVHEVGRYLFRRKTARELVDAEGRLVLPELINGLGRQPSLVT